MATTDRAIQRKLADFEKHDRALEEMGLRQLLSSPGGKRVLWWLLRITSWGTHPYTKNALDTAFKCGELNIAQQIVARLGEIDPGLLPTLMEEMGREQNDRNAILSRIDDTGPASASDGTSENSGDAADD